MGAGQEGICFAYKQEDSTFPTIIHVLEMKVL